MNHASLESIVEKQKKRYQVLLKIYEMAGDDPQHGIRPQFFYETGLLLQKEVFVILAYLDNEGLIKRGETLYLTHKGIKEVEDSIQHPNRPTEHFSTVVIQHFYGDVKGGVQVNGEGNSQTVSIISGENDGNK
jgi:hypothetical protein